MNKNEIVNLADVLPREELRDYVICTKQYFNHAFKNVKPKSKFNLQKTEFYTLPKIYTKYGKRSRRFYVTFLLNELSEENLRLNLLKV